IFIVYFVVESKCLTFDYTHAIAWKECEFEHGSPIGNSIANLEERGKLNSIFARRLGSAPPGAPSASATARCCEGGVWLERTRRGMTMGSIPRVPPACDFALLAAFSTFVRIYLYHFNFDLRECCATLFYSHRTCMTSGR